MSLLIHESAEANIDYIVVDNYSRDRSMNIVNQIISNYKGNIQFMILSHDKNCGLSAARNTGLKHATGDYIYFVDSDDYLMPDSLQYFLDNLKVYPAELFIALADGDATCWRKIGVEHLNVIPNPVTCYPILSQNVEKKEGRIICVGCLTPQKRFDRLIDAFSLIAARYSDWYITIFGEGEDKEKLHKQIAVRNMDNRNYAPMGRSVFKCN